MKHKVNGNLSLSDTQMFVADEADTLFKDGFIQDLTSIIKVMQNREELSKYPRQFITVSATLPRDVVSQIKELVPVSINEINTK